MFVWIFPYVCDFVWLVRNYVYNVYIYIHILGCALLFVIADQSNNPTVLYPAVVGYWAVYKPPAVV